MGPSTSHWKQFHIHRQSCSREGLQPPHYLLRKIKTEEHKQFRMFLECITNYFLAQETMEPMRRDVLQDLTVWNKKSLISDVKAECSLGFSDRVMLDFKMRRA